MSLKLEDLLKEIHNLENAVVEELRKDEKGLLYKIRSGKVIFEKDVQARHRSVRLSLHKFLFQSSFLTVVTAPVIYALIVPALMLDVMTQFYQMICFPVYEIPKVVRAEYVVMDRRKLKYLNLFERTNCTYCSYFNGVIAFVREVAARTEHYWCPIRHALRAKGWHARANQFLPYGDEMKYHQRLDEIRRQLRNENLAAKEHSGRAQ